MREIKLIPLKLSRPVLLTIVDDEDYEWLNKYEWGYRKPRDLVYAETHIDGKTITMSRLIMNAPDNMNVDHINMNTLDNRRSNLRLATYSQSSAYRNKTKSATYSRYKNVTWHKNRQKWQVQLEHKDKSYYGGQFDSEEAAARKADQIALKLFGEFAKLNFPRE